jgi:hypothetical protein
MRKLMISETPPKSNQSLVDYNLHNIGQIQLIDPKTANELKAADYLNQAYHEWSKASSTSSALVRVASCLFMTGWLSLGLLFSFVIGRFQFYSIDKQKSKRVRA